MTPQFVFLTALTNTDSCDGSSITCFREVALEPEGMNALFIALHLKRKRLSSYSLKNHVVYSPT